jgi:hypothetical protein
LTRGQLFGLATTSRGASESGRLAFSTALIERVRFAPDSPLEGDGFEPSVPRRDSVPGRDRPTMRWFGPDSPLEGDGVEPVPPPSVPGNRLGLSAGALPTPPRVGRSPPISLRNARVPSRASKSLLRGVCVARLTLWKPPAPITSRSRASPACAPSAAPTSCNSEVGMQIIIEPA